MSHHTNESGQVNNQYEYEGTELELFAEARNWKAYFGELLRPFISGRVLEVGAGIGATTMVLLNEAVSSWTCLEPDPELARQLRESVRQLSPNPRVIVGTIEDISDAGPFDTILYIDVLEHIENDAEEVRRAAAQLESNGRLVILAPAFQGLYSAFDRAIGHHRRYTRESLRRVFPEKMREHALFYADALGATLSLANRLLLRRASPRLASVKFWDRFFVPISRRIDPLIGRSVGRSVIAVFEAP